MKGLRLFRLELGRLLRGRFTWLALALTALSPAAGLTFYRPLASTSTADYVTTTLGTCLANPALAAGLLGGVLFALLTLFELDRARRSQVDMLVDAVISPLSGALVRLWALLCTAAWGLVLTMLLWLPYTLLAAGAVFDWAAYLLAYLIFMGLALPLAILLAAAADQLTHRFDLALVLVLALAGLSLTVWRGQWQLCWLNPCVWAISDDFSNDRIFRSVAYMRLTWLLGLAGLWTVSYLCIRRYGKGPVGSLLRSARRVYRPAAAVLLLACSGFAYAAQPFLDHSNPDLSAMSLLMMDYAEGITCSGRSADVRPDFSAGTVSGTATYQFQNTSGQERTAAFGINPGYRITSATANGAPASVRVDGYQESNMALVEVTLPAEEEITLTLEYSGFPREWNINDTRQGEPEISRRYLCLENQDLAPYLLNAEYRDGVLPAAVDITLPEGMTAIPFGSQEARVTAEHEDGTRTWSYEDSGAGGILYAGDYVREELQAGGLTIQFYYGRKHQDVMEKAGAAEAVRAVVEYCTDHYGALSFGGGGTLKLIQSRVSGGGYAGGGASLLDELDFTAQNLNNGEKGAVPGEVMIHELVHQWWGLGNMFDVAEADSPWSSEGLTVYTTYRIVKELYGAEYAQTHYVDQWRQAVDDYYLNFYVRHPEYLEALPEEERLSITNSLTQVRQYSEMPLKLLKAEELVGGEEAMDRILHQLFNRELDWTYPYLTYEEFLDACGLTEEELSLD